MSVTAGVKLVRDETEAQYYYLCRQISQANPSLKIYHIE